MPKVLVLYYSFTAIEQMAYAAAEGARQAARTRSSSAFPASPRGGRPQRALQARPSPHPSRRSTSFRATTPSSSEFPTRYGRRGSSWGTGLTVSQINSARQ